MLTWEPIEILESWGKMVLSVSYDNKGYRHD